MSSSSPPQSGDDAAQDDDAEQSNLQLLQDADLSGSDARVSVAAADFTALLVEMREMNRYLKALAAEKSPEQCASRIDPEHGASEALASQKKQDRFSWLYLSPELKKTVTELTSIGCPEEKKRIDFAWNFWPHMELPKREVNVNEPAESLTDGQAILRIFWRETSPDASGSQPPTGAKSPLLVLWVKKNKSKTPIMVDKTFQKYLVERIQVNDKGGEKMWEEASRNNQGEWIFQATDQDGTYQALGLRSDMDNMDYPRIWIG